MTNSIQPSALQAKLRVTWNSIGLTLLLVAAKVGVGLATHSLSLLSQATDSVLDLVGLLVTLFAVRISATPPDSDHLYGHGKFENLSALLQSLLLLVITVFIANEAVQRLLATNTPSVQVNVWSFIVLGVSMSVDVWRTRLLRSAGKEHRSQALEASALNFMTDLLSAIVVTIGLAAVLIFGWREADAWAAIGVSMFVAYLSIRLGLRAIDGLTDRFTESKEYHALEASIRTVNGVETLRRLRVRQAGPAYFVEVVITIGRTLPFAAIEQILKEVEDEVRERFEQADITVHWLPVRTERESPFETLRLVAAEFGIAPHNVELTSTESGERILDYHLEFPPRTSLVEAEQLAKRLEANVRHELPSISRVLWHLEEERSDRALREVRDITERKRDMREGIEYVAKNANRRVRAVHSIELWELLDTRELKLALSIELPDSVSLNDAHDIATNVEEELRKRYPELGRVVVQMSAASLQAASVHSQ